MTKKGRLLYILVKLFNSIHPNSPLCACRRIHTLLGSGLTPVSELRDQLLLGEFRKQYKMPGIEPRPATAFTLIWVMTDSKAKYKACPENKLDNNF